MASSVTREIRLPIVISANGAKAVAGLKQFQSVGQQLDRTLGKWSGAQLSGVSGILAGYLGIDAAIDGMKKIYAEADRLQGLARVYSPAVAQAYGQRMVAEHQADKAAATQIAPLAVEREQVATRMAQPDVANKLAEASAAFGLNMDQIWAGVKLKAAGAMTMFSDYEKGRALVSEGEALGVSAVGMSGTTFDLNSTALTQTLLDIVGNVREFVTSDFQPQNNQTDMQRLIEIMGEVAGNTRGQR